MKAILFAFLIIFWIACAVGGYKLQLRFMRKFRKGLSYGIDKSDKIVALCLAIIFGPIDVIVGILCNTMEGWEK